MPRQAVEPAVRSPSRAAPARARSNPWRALWARLCRCLAGGPRAGEPLSPSAARAARAKAVGAWGETEAAGFLRKKGWKILARNLRYGPKMELDIVARQPSPPVLVFVEVKTRKNADFGRPIDAVDAMKRRAMGRAAGRYLRQLGRRRPRHWRADVVEVVGEPGSPPLSIRHIEAAFPLPDFPYETQR